MKLYKTKTGGEYLVNEEAKLIRMKVRGPQNISSRLTGEWQPYEEIRTADSLDILMGGNPGGLMIIWGGGRDKVSDELGTPDVPMQRATTTSPVVSVEEVTLD